MACSLLPAGIVVQPVPADSTSAAPRELLATCQGRPISDADRAAVVALSLDPNYLAYLGAMQAYPGGNWPRLRELAAAVFYGPPDAYAVDLH